MAINFIGTRNYLSTSAENMYSRFLNMIVCVLICLATNSQQFNKKDFKVYGSKDGLSNRGINAIIQDAYGYIWLGTEKGLNRFNGASFQQFFSDSFPNSLPEDRVFNLKWINEEELGVLTGAGLNVINTRTLHMRTLLIPADSTKDRSHVNRITDIAADKKANIFITTSGGFYHFNNNNLVFRYDHADKAISFGWDVIKVVDNTLLLSTNDGLYIYNIEKKDMHRPGNNDDPFLRMVATPELRFRFKYADENLFALGHRGASLVLFDSRKKTSQQITEPPGLAKKLNISGKLFKLSDTTFAVLSTAKGFHIIHVNNQKGSWLIDTTLYFENDFCTALLVDKNNNLWVGTSDGLYQQNKPGTHVDQTQLPGEGGGLQRTITGIAVANDKIFAATVFDGIYVFDKTQLIPSGSILYPQGQTFIPRLEKLTEDSLMTAGNGFLVDTRNSTYKKIEPDKILGNAPIRGMFKDSRNRIYFTRNRVDTLYFKDPADKNFSAIKLPELLKLRTQTQISEDNEGNIWIGGYGIMRFNGQLKKIDLFIDSFPFIKNQHKEITSNMVFDKTGSMYFGVFGNGLIIYSVKHKTFTHITRSDGLPDNVIKALYLDNNNVLWLATENGLANYDITNKKVSSFGASDGMPADFNNCSALYFDTADHHLYAAATPFIVRFDPAGMKKNGIPPSFFVESVDIAGKESLFHPGNAISVLYKHNNVAINLAAINFEDAAQQLFAYRLLKDGDEPWQELGTQRRILFNDLAVGKHRLQVKVYIRNQSWPDQIKEITIIVKPPFWKTIWFFLLIGLVVAAVLYSFHRRRIDSITQKANVDRQLAQTEMKALHAQMNPHFIFNCLNSIREMILNNENEQASLYLSKFARLIRITLNQSSKQFVSLADTVDYLERYIEMEKIRNSHFTYTIEVAQDLNRDDIMVPPMLIQPFIENAIWHGASPKKNMNVHIAFSKKGNELICIVDDDGIGIEESLKRKENPAHEPSVGIANIKQRISLLNEKYNLHSTVHIADKLTLPVKNGTGTIVTLHLPLKNNEGSWN